MTDVKTPKYPEDFPVAANLIPGVLEWKTAWRPQPEQLGKINVCLLIHPETTRSVILEWTRALLHAHDVVPLVSPVSSSISQFSSSTSYVPKIPPAGTQISIQLLKKPIDPSIEPGLNTPVEPPFDLLGAFPKSLNQIPPLVTCILEYLAPRALRAALAALLPSDAVADARYASKRGEVARRRLFDSWSNHLKLLQSLVPPPSYFTTGAYVCSTSDVGEHAHLLSKEWLHAKKAVSHPMWRYDFPLMAVVCRSSAVDRSFHFWRSRVKTRTPFVERLWSLESYRHPPASHFGHLSDQSVWEMGVFDKVRRIDFQPSDRCDSFRNSASILEQDQTVVDEPYLPLLNLSVFEYGWNTSDVQPRWLILDQVVLDETNTLRKESHHLGLSTLSITTVGDWPNVIPGPIRDCLDWLLIDPRMVRELFNLRLGRPEDRELRSFVEHLCPFDFLLNIETRQGQCPSYVDDWIQTNTLMVIHRRTRRAHNTPYVLYWSQPQFASASQKIQST